MKNSLFFVLCIILFSNCTKSGHDNNNSGNSNTGNSITKFYFNTNPTVQANIGTDDTISFVLPAGYDPSDIAPEIEFSSGASISPKPDDKKDFTNPVQYTVTSASGVSKNYYAKATIPTPPYAPYPPQYLGIVYCWPSVVGVNALAQFDILVLGNTLDSATHPDHNNTINIIAMLKTQKPAIKIYGYIDASLTIDNFSIYQIESKVDAWAAMGVNGIFYDDMGTNDFQVTRSRQNSIIDYAHAKGLSVFVNANNPDDVLADNNGGTHLNNTDYYLFESGLLKWGSLTSMSEFKAKADRAYYYKRTTGIGICMTSTLADKATQYNSNNSDFFKMAWCAAAMYGFDAFQFADKNYSSTSSQVFFYRNFVSSFGSYWADADWVKTVSATVLSRHTDTKTIQITDDGITGTGIITNR